MKESLLIKNFGPILEIELDNIVPLTVFIGESGSGKSTIIKVLILFRWIYKKLNLRYFLNESGIQKSPFRFQFEKYLRNNGFEGFVKDNTVILYKRDDYEIIYANRKLNTKKSVINRNDISLDKLSFISDKRNMIPDLLAKRMKESVANFFLNETYQDFLEASKNLDIITIPYFDVSLVKVRNSSDLQYFIKGGNNKSGYSVRFEDVSSGMQNVIPMEYLIEYFTHKYNILDSFNKSLLSYAIETDSLMNFKPQRNIGGIKAKNIFIHIEEPELSLYPDMQISFMKKLLQNCFNNKNEIKYGVCITTHSPYIVNYLNLAIKNRSISYEDVSVNLIYKGYHESLMRDSDKIIDTRVLSDAIADIYKEYNLNKV